MDRREGLRRAKAKSSPASLTQEIILFCKRLSARWSVLGRLQLGNGLPTQNGDRCSIPLLEMGQPEVQKTLTHLLGCQHPPRQSCEPLRIRWVY